jgi:hypothetical protein
MNLGFLRKVLPKEGDADCYFGFSLLGKSDPRTERFARVEDLYRHGLEQSSRGREAYFAVAGFGPGPRRTADNALKFRAVYLDIDCGDKPSARYPDMEQGILALAAFVKASGLPEPIVACSGAGLHVYWPFDRTLDRAEWYRLAVALKSATSAPPLVADPSRGAEASTVLRVPGTYNYNYVKGGGKPLPVTVMRDGDPTDPDVLGRLLEAYAGGPGGSHPPRVPAQVPEPELPGFLSYYCEGRRDRDPIEALRECAQLRAAGRPKASRNSWFLMLAVMRHCRGGREAAHQISAYDKARYDPATLDRQFDSAGTFGPVRCETFMRENPAPCRGCKWEGRVATPLSAARAASAGPVKAEDTLPEGVVPYRDDEFKVVPGRGLFYQAASTDPNEPRPRSIKINDNEFYVREILADTGALQERRFLRMTVRAAGKPYRDVLMDLSADFKGPGLGTWLANHGLFPLRTRYMKLMGEFMGSYLASIQNRANVKERKSHFGWANRLDRRTGKSEEGLVVGARMYFGRARPETVMLDQRCAAIAEREYRQAGDLETWKIMPRLYGELDQKEAQLYMCASFAAPFMRTGVGTAKNLVMNIWDEVGGKGKTTLLQAVNSVWGHPADLTCAKSDTMSARYQMLSARRNLPFCMDELTNMGAADVSSLLFDIANGREKRKSNTSGSGLLETGQWETITLLTSNRSIYELMREISGQTTAESMRVLELPCKFESFAGTDRGRDIEARIEIIAENYGHAGPAFVNDCLAEPGASESIADAARTYDRRVRSMASERFWSYGLGIILAAGRKAVALGYLDYDMDSLERWTEARLLPQLRGLVQESVQPSMTLLASYFNANVDKTLVVEDAAPPPPTGNAGEDAFARTAFAKRMPLHELRIRHEMRQGTVYADASHFGTWCGRQRLSSTAILDYLEAMGIWDGALCTKVLGEHVDLLTQTGVQCYRFELDASILGMLDGKRNVQD